MKFSPRTLRTEPGFNGKAAPKTARPLPVRFERLRERSYRLLRSFSRNSNQRHRLPATSRCTCNCAWKSDNVFNHTQFNGNVARSTSANPNGAAGRQSQLGGEVPLTWTSSHST